MKTVQIFPAFALHWAKELGAHPNSLERLKGGINNWVFRCSDGKQKWVIKGYEPAQTDKRDRMAAEHQFLQFASQVAPGFTPALFHVDPDFRCLVLENVEGKAFTKGLPPNADAVEAATRFIKMLNSEPRIGCKYIQLDAAEGFISLRQHMNNVIERIEAMSCEHLSKDERKIAERLIKQVTAKHTKIKEETNNLIEKGYIADCIGLDERCISPSDFGFHNAIETEKGVCFIDFEFSGWDDPAKATIDFILQPQVPVIGFGSPLLSAWRPKIQKVVEERCKHLEPILRMKWVCIILGILNHGRFKQILADRPGITQGLLIEERLKNAETCLKLMDI